MSVAFRRDGDEEHKEPRFEIPIPRGVNLVTKRGLHQIETRVAEFETLIATEGDETRIAEAKRDLRYWRTRLATAQLAPLPAGDEASFGTRVRFRLNGKERTIDIVGDDEADPSSDRIAFSAPLARVLLGAVAGDQVDFNGRTEAVEVLAISLIEDQVTRQR